MNELSANSLPIPRIPSERYRDRLAGYRYPIYVSAVDLFNFGSWRLADVAYVCENRLSATNHRAWESWKAHLAAVVDLLFASLAYHFILLNVCICISSSSSRTALCLDLRFSWSYSQHYTISAWDLPEIGTVSDAFPSKLINNSSDPNSNKVNSHG